MPPLSCLVAVVVLATAIAQAAQAVTSVGTGNWSNPATWNTGVIPTSNDDVTISDGTTVTINTAAVAHLVTVGAGGSTATLIFDSTAARSLNVGTSVMIASNGKFQSANIGSVSSHSLSVGADLINNGVLDFFRTPSKFEVTGVTINFTGASNNTFGGAGSRTNIRAIAINKGTSSASVLELNPTNFLVQGESVDDGALIPFLTLNNGTLKISGTFTMSQRVFSPANYTIPATAGFWLNNPNFTVLGQHASATNNGLFRISQGTFNVGTASGDSINAGTGASFTVEGGTTNVAGGLTTANAATYTHSGGILNVSTVGGGGFNLPSGSTANVSGGIINLVQSAGYSVLGNATFTGGTLNTGTGNANSSFTVSGTAFNVIVGGNPSFSPITTFLNTTVLGNLTVQSGVYLRLGSFNGGVSVQFLGGVFTNYGNIYNDIASAIITFSRSSAQTFAGDGYCNFGDGTSRLILDNPVGLMVDPNSTGFFVTKIEFRRGGITGAPNVHVGGSGGSEIDYGGAGFTAGNFDVDPSFDGDGRYLSIFYDSEPTARTSGPELDIGELSTLAINNSNGVTLAGIFLDDVLELDSGNLITGGGTIALGQAGVVDRTSGHVIGNLDKYVLDNNPLRFEIGTAFGYTPVTLIDTASTPSGSHVAIRATAGRQPNYAGTTALKCYWTIGNFPDPANLSFQYLPSDVVGNESVYVLARFANGTFTVPAGGSVNTSTHVASISNVNSIAGDWFLLEPDADFDGMPDVYEDAHGLNKNNATDANTDLDHDGQSNLAEYLAGTDPQNPNSVLRITSITRNGSNAVISFNAVANKSYRLEFKNAITDSVWQMVSDLTPNTTGTAQIPDAAAGGTARFYRIHLLLP